MPKNMLTIAFQETDETIQLTVYRSGHNPEIFHLDADDRSWELTMNDDFDILEFRTN